MGTINKELCPVCGQKKVGCCRCSGPHSMEELKKGHGAVCANGHRWSYDGDKATVLKEEEKTSDLNIKLLKSKELPKPETEMLKLLVQFVKFAAGKLGISDKPFVIRLLHAAPAEPVTTGAYEPSTKRISVIIQNRHFIDYCRTIAHEMTHQKQDYQGRTTGEIPDIGGKIEDEANAVSGRIVKAFLKNELTPEQKKFLGLGTY